MNDLAPQPDAHAVRCRESGALFADTISRIPAWLEEATHAALPARPGTLGAIVTTGIGASEPPARLLAALLVQAGFAARFCSTSAFAHAQPPRGDLLVSFSQGLSPNALLALGETHGFARRWLVSSVGPDSPQPEKRAQRALLEARGIEVICLPPAREPAWLVRLAGPTVAALGALRIAALLGALPSLQDDIELAARAYREGCREPSPEFARLAAREGALPEEPLAFITLGASLEGALAHRCKLMETLLVPEPPVWDVLQFAHGPLQAYFAAPLTLLVLEGPSDGELVARLASTLDASRHTLRRLISPYTGPAGLFAHAAAVDTLLAATLAARPRDLTDWPAKRGDAPLYELGRTP